MHCSSHNTPMCLICRDVLSYISSKRLEPKPLQAITAQQPLVSPATVKDLTRFSPSFDLSPQVCIRCINVIGRRLVDVIVIVYGPIS